MAIQQLRQLNRNQLSVKTTALRQPSAVVTDFGPALHQLISDLIDTLKFHRIAVGLSAPQIGVNFRVAVVNIDSEKRDPTLVLVNPIVLSSSGKREKMKESCMSLPNCRGSVERRDKILIRYLDESGNGRQLEEHGLMARVIQHEIDHLDGVLYVDRMENTDSLESVEFF